MVLLVLLEFLRLMRFLWVLLLVLLLVSVFNYGGDGEIGGVGGGDTSLVGGGQMFCDVHDFYCNAKIAANQLRPHAATNTARLR
jgi:hypothetical protein